MSAPPGSINGSCAPARSSSHGIALGIAELADSTGRQARLRLALALNRVRTVTQAEAAKLLGVSQPKVSALRNYELDEQRVHLLGDLRSRRREDVRVGVRRRTGYEYRERPGQRHQG